jgi:hypothetical protein
VAANTSSSVYQAQDATRPYGRWIESRIVGRAAGREARSRRSRGDDDERGVVVAGFAGFE